MNPVNVKSSTSIDFNKKKNKEDLKFNSFAKRVAKDKSNKT